MRALVVLRTSRGRFAVPVEATRAVLEPIGLVPLPSPKAGVLGVLRPERHGLPVLDVLDGDGEHVVVLEVGGPQFGVLVESVSGVVKAPDDAFGEPPAGQEDRMVAARVVTPDGAVLVLDPAALARTLD